MSGFPQTGHEIPLLFLLGFYFNTENVKNASRDISCAYFAANQMPFLQVMVKNVCLHVRFSSLMTDRAGFFSFPRATYFPRVRTCTSFKVCHVTRKQTSPCSYVVISANEAYDGGVGAHDLLIVSTFFRSHTCFEVPVCSHDGFLGEEEISSS